MCKGCVHMAILWIQNKFLYHIVATLFALILLCMVYYYGFSDGSVRVRVRVSLTDRTSSLSETRTSLASTVISI